MEETEDTPRYLDLAHINDERIWCDALWEDMMKQFGDVK